MKADRDTGDGVAVGALVCSALALALLPACSAEPDPATDGEVVITYWRHHNESENATMAILIERFEATRPGVRVEMKTFPFNVYMTKVVATLTAGLGPDIVNLHNSWIHDYVDSGLIEPVPDDLFADGELENEFFPLMGAFSEHGVTYGVPVGGGNLGLYYHRGMLAEAGIEPPRTWSELEAAARQLARRDDHGRLIRAGASLGEGDGQGWNTLVDALFPQRGVGRLAADGRSVAWDTPAGAEVLGWYTDFAHGDDAPNSVLFPKPNEAFRLELSAMIIDGNWRIGVLQTEAPELDYGTAPLPVADGGVPATYGTAWGHAVTRRAEGPVRDAAWELIHFLAEYESMKTWSEGTGELPMRRRVLEDEDYRARMAELTGDRIQPFMDQMAFAEASLKKDEGSYKAAVVEAIDRVLLQDAEPAAALHAAAAKEDEMLERR
jgi:multiple sugar transport system substrate-binding protein